MKTITIAAALGLLVTAASAQQFQGLGAADPSQQLKTAGMMNTFQNQNTFRRDERKEPLVQGTSDPGETTSERSTAQPLPAPGTQAAQAVTVAPSPSPSPSYPPPVATSTEAPAQLSNEPLRPVPVLDRGASRPAATWNPAAQPAPAAAGATVAPSARLSRVQELVDQIKRRREAR